MQCMIGYAKSNENSPLLSKAIPEYLSEDPWKLRRDDLKWNGGLVERPHTSYFYYICIGTLAVNFSIATHTFYSA
jgi:hypothetical protein